MKLLFDKTTRRMMGSIEGSTKGMPANLIVVTGTMPDTPDTAHLNADNTTVGTKALTSAERSARTRVPGKKQPAAKPTPADRSAAYKAIDTAAGNARLRYVTQGALQQQVYDIKAAEAAAYIEAAYPTDTTPYPLITAQALGMGTTVKAAADTIVATRAKWLTLAGVIESVRLLGKASVKVTVTSDTLSDSEINTLKTLDAI